MKKFLIAALIAVTGMASAAMPAAQAANGITITTGDDGVVIRDGHRNRNHDRRDFRRDRREFIREDRRDFRRHRERDFRRHEVRDNNCRTRTVRERHHGRVVIKSVSVCG